MSDLNAENVARAIEHFLNQEVTEGLTSHPELILSGVPDDKMAKLLEAKGGEIRVVIRGVPRELMAALKEESGLPIASRPFGGVYLNR